MFMFMAFLSLLWFVLTDILFTNFWSKLWGYSSSFYSSGALVITMMPMLFLFDSSFENMNIIVLLQFLLVWFSWALWMMFHLESYMYLPVWIAGSIVKMSTPLVILLSYLFYGEVLSVTSMMGWSMLLTSVMMLSLNKTNHSHLKNNHTLWVMFSLLTGLFGSLWFFWLSYYGSELWVWLSAYFSEAMMFVALMILLPINKIISWKYLEKTNYTDFGKMFMYSTSALLGTWWFAYATKLWDMGTVSLISATWPVFVAIFWYFFFKENLSKLQWTLIITTFFGLAVISL